jgi:hypothetical protein
VNDIYDTEDVQGQTVGYIVEAVNSVGQPVRLGVEQADEFGPVAAPTVEDGLDLVRDCKSGMRYDVVKKYDVRSRIDAFMVYPVRADGSVGRAKCMRNDEVEVV